MVDDRDGDGFAQGAGDCDDRDPSVRPGADDVPYDGIDQDCSGSDANDLDRDGFPGGPDGSDCDDLSAAVRPGVREICGDHVDNDCDGTHNGCALTGTIPLAWADARLSGDAPDLLFGHDVAGIGDLNRDGYDDVAVAVRDPYGGLPAKVYVFYGPIAGALELAQADAILATDDPQTSPGWVEGVGDTNGDGYDDIALALTWPQTGGGYIGAAMILHGPLFGSIDVRTAALPILGEPPDTLFSFDFDVAGDVNGDGFDDVVLSSGYQGNSVYLLLGGPQLPTSLDELIRLEGEPDDEHFGTIVAGLGDANGDQLGDFLVTSPRVAGSHVIFVYYGTRDELADATQPGATIEIRDTECGVDWHVAGIGDTQRDGHGDIALICPGSGRLYLFTRVLQGSTASTDDADAIIVSFTDGWGKVSGAGDVNGDGYADVVVGRPLQAGGNVYLAFGPLQGQLDESAFGAVFLGENAGDQAGCDIDGAGDIDGDGFDDLIIGARYGDLGGPQVGGAYLLLGRGR